MDLREPLDQATASPTATSSAATATPLRRRARRQLFTRSLARRASTRSSWINEAHHPNILNTNIHWIDEQLQRRTRSRRFVREDKRLSRDFYTFGFLWNEQELVWYFEGTPIRGAPNTFAHSDAAVYLSAAICRIMKLAIAERSTIRHEDQPMIENQQTPAATIDNTHRQARTSSAWEGEREGERGRGSFLAARPPPAYLLALFVISGSCPRTGRWMVLHHRVLASWVGIATGQTRAGARVATPGLAGGPLTSCR